MNILQRAIRNLNLFTGTYNEKLLKYFKYAGATSSVLQDAEKQYLIGKLGNKAYANQDYWKELEAVYGTSEQLIANDVARANGAVLYTVPDDYVKLGPELAPVNSATITTLGDGRYRVEANSTGRLYFGSANLVQGAFYKIAFNIESFTGSATFNSDWCDSTSYPSSPMTIGPVSYVGQRAFYDSTYQFLDITTGAASTLTINSVRIQQILSDTLYQDSAGTTPVSTVGQLVGLMLDSTATVGAELCPPLAAGNGWNTGTQTTLATGSVSVTNSASAQPFLYKAILTVGKTYDVTYTISSITAGNFYPFVGSSGLGHLVTQATPGTYTARLVCAGNGNGGLACEIGTTGTVTNVSYKEITGTHATQATTANKPGLVRGLYNLLTYSNDLTNAAWVKLSSPTITPNASTGPGGMGFAQRLLCNTNANVYRTLAVSVGVVSTVAVIFKQDTSPKFGIEFNAGITGELRYEFGVGIITNSCLTNPTVVALQDGYYLLAGQVTSTTVNPNFFLYGNGYYTAPPGASLMYATGHFAGTLTAQQILANGGIPLTTSAAGWNQTAGRHLLSFDGVNDTLTFTPQPITTQATLVWAGTINSLAANCTPLGQGIGGVNLYVDTDGKVRISDAVSKSFSTGTGLIAANTPVVISAQVAINGTSVLRINGVQAASSAAMTSNLTGTVMGIMARPDATAYAPGTVGFCEVSNTILSLADLQAAERAAAQTIGIDL